MVVQYRGEIMPLIRISEALHLPEQERTGDRTGKTQVVVFSEDGRSVGLVVDRIVDIVEETVIRQRPSKREGLFGSAVIQQKVTDLLDVHSLIRGAIPDFFESELIGRER